MNTAISTANLKIKGQPSNGDTLQTALSAYKYQHVLQIKLVESKPGNIWYWYKQNKLSPLRIHSSSPYIFSLVSPEIINPDVLINDSHASYMQMNTFQMAAANFCRIHSFEKAQQRKQCSEEGTALQEWSWAALGHQWLTVLGIQLSASSGFSCSRAKQKHFSTSQGCSED